jgi:hypothetical protein
VKRVRTIAQEGVAQIRNAAQFQIPLDPKDKPTEETFRKLVESPEFQETKEKTRRSAREAWNAVIGRIEAMLDEEQRANYRRTLGKPFDLTRLEFERRAAEIDSDAETVTRALDLGDQTVGGAGGSGGQRAHPNFDVKVARPTVASGTTGAANEDQ